MTEGFPKSDLSESEPGYITERNTSFENVAQRVAKLLDALEETAGRFPDVELPSGEFMSPTTREECLLARAQRLKEGLQGYREQVEARDAYHEAQAVALLEDAVQHLAEYMAVRADIENETDHTHGARALADVLDRIMECLVPPRAKSATPIHDTP